MPAPLLRKWESNEWDQLLDQFASDWHLILFHNNIVLNRDSTHPTTLSLYSHNSLQDPSTTYWFLHKKCNVGIDDTLIIFLCDGTYVDSNFRRAFAEFCVLHPIFELDKMLIAGDVEILNSVKALAEEDPKLQPINVNPTIIYYFDEEARERIQHLKIPTLPEGYALGVVDVEKDSRIINSTWIYSDHSEKGDAKMRHRLEHLPNAVIHKDSYPVAYIYTNITGAMSHLFVEPEHRRKGLANTVEFALAQKLAKRGYIPTKHVVLDNTFVIQSSDRNPFYTKALNEDGSVAEIAYLEIFSKTYLHNNPHLIH